MRGLGEAEGWVAEVVPFGPDVSCRTTQNKNKTSENRKQITEIESRKSKEQKKQRAEKSKEQKHIAENKQQELESRNCKEQKKQKA